MKSLEIRALPATLGRVELELDRARAANASLNAQLDDSHRQPDQEKEGRRVAVAGESDAQLRLQELELALSKERRLREKAEKRESAWRREPVKLSEKIEMTDRSTHNQVSDEYLSGEVKKLRFNIKSFAFTYFCDARLKGAVLEFALPVVTRSKEVVNIDVRAAKSKSWSVIQARIWFILVHFVFGRSEPGDEATERNNDSGASDEARRKPQTQSAKASGQRSASLRSKGPAATPLQRLKEAFGKAVAGLVEPQQDVLLDDNAFDELNGIFDLAVKLDKVIRKQPYHVSWVLPRMSAGFLFDPSTMEVPKDEEEILPNHETIFIIVAPGLLQRSESSPDSIEESDHLLLPIGVSGSVIFPKSKLRKCTRYLGGAIEAEL